MKPARHIAALLRALDTVGAQIVFNAAGDGLKVQSLDRPPSDLMEKARKYKLELFVYLQEASTGERHQVLGTANPPDWDFIASLPGHCGCCALAKPAPMWGTDMLICQCRQDAWWPLSPPLAVHRGASCGAYQRPDDQVGRGWRRQRNR